MSVTEAKSPRMSAPQRREQLLDATRDIAAERGFHEISIDAVAKRAGITRPTLDAWLKENPDA